MAIGAGTITVLHTSYGFFQVVTQFSHMSADQGYCAQTAATAIQGVGAILWLWFLSWLVL